MDPFLLGAVLRETNLHNLQQAAGRDEAARVAEQIRIHAWKKEVMQEVTNIVAEIFHEPPEHAPQSFVKISIEIIDLAQFEIVPDAFEDLKEKEDVVLLWRKLQNFANTLSGKLNEDQKTACRKCLDAILMYRFINTIAPFVQANDEFTKFFDEWEIAKTRLNKARQKDSLILLGSGFLIESMLLIYLYKTSSPGYAYYLLTGVILLILLMAWGQLISYRRRGMRKLDAKKDRFVAEADVNNDQMWQAIEKAFDGIPNSDSLPQ